MKRNLDRWTKQFEASKTDDTDKQMPEMAQLIQWLKANMPAADRTSLVHGDFRLDNLIFDVRQAQVRAVLDWELSTLGDPLTDLATNCFPYYLPSSFPMLQGFAGSKLPDGTTVFCSFRCLCEIFRRITRQHPASFDAS